MELGTCFLSSLFHDHGTLTGVRLEVGRQRISRLNLLEEVALFILQGLGFRFGIKPPSLIG